jgi:hypothetical protein
MMLQDIIRVKLGRNETLELTISLIKKDSSKIVLFHTYLPNFTYTFVQRDKSKTRRVLICSDKKILNTVCITAKTL